MASPSIQTDTTTIAGYEIYPHIEAFPQESAQAPRPVPHPLDQLDIIEISTACKIIKEAHAKKTKFNCITLHDPPKAEYAAFKRGAAPRPVRKAFAIVLEEGTNNTSEVIVNLKTGEIEDWKDVTDVAATLTLEDLDVVEVASRKDPRVIAACAEIGITDMSKVYIDGWAIGVDKRWAFERRLQQGLVYYRNSELDNQYAHPLDISIVADTDTGEILAVDIAYVNGERTAAPLVSHNFLPDFIANGYKTDVLKPIDITQPQGVSFQVRGNELAWAGYKMHIGFNYREGIVISDVTINDPYENRERTLFNRISVVEMVVPYGNPDAPHHKKHAFDVGEYGTGLMTNSLKLGCDCKGAIHYLDAIMSTNSGQAAVLKNAICIHEEDNGILYKHTDYRDGTVVAARDRKLIISQIITAANYEYAFYHTFSLDGTYNLEIKLTGQLNTYCMGPDDVAAPYGTQVAESITAHNHQHIFCLRVDPEIDGPNNSVVQNDAVISSSPTGSAANPFGNAFYCKKTTLRTAKEGATSYCHETGRNWDIINPNVINGVAKKPIGYKIINNSCPALLAQPDAVVAKRAHFATKTLFVTPYRDHEKYPAGDYVCQSTGQMGHPFNQTMADWVERDENIENTDIVLYNQFGLTHFPRTEDFPVMPAEPVGIMIRASNFFQKNPALWVPPSTVAKDVTSRAAFAAAAKKNASSGAGACCGSKSQSHL
ncbi:Putative Amine oxidase [[Torrubiella] hemipterigena]|uniref:Amine oxidase n=1 Tax=[Torrubiella] hemipterigena TaxID=1531966 RepID=A0A0A1TEL1_9HYPO|nr:Putative Amine oxidase [[Torrubiella] hemipterigena]